MIMVQPLFTAEQVREIDRQAIQTLSITGYDLMQRAGLVLFEQLKQVSAHKEAVHIFCGAGNNAGDGYVLAKLLLESGITPHVYALSVGADLTGDALSAFKAYSQLGSVNNVLPTELSSGVIVDALIGTGLNKPLMGAYLDAVKLINRAQLTTLAVDIPSGLNADTGYVQDDAVRADKTVSFIGLKRGLYTADGPSYSGKIMLDDLSVPQSLFAIQPVETEMLSLAELKKNHQPREKNSHKGDFGHALMVGGDHGFSGAIRLAGEAALRAGAGLVSIATRKEHAAFISVARAELMSHGISGRADFKKLATWSTVLAVGPGLGQTPWAYELFEVALDLNKPMVVDADGLNLLAKEPRKNNSWVLTPHPAEAARLLACTTQQVQCDRFAAVKQLQQQYGGVVVLKGSGSLICGGGNVYVCAAGNPGMASGGMGDVLTGIIAALLAQGSSLIEAAKLGVMVHSVAADRAIASGEKGLLASDLMPYIKELMNEY
ncbi:MAG: NAD(P)H-hydrate dehydratase [Cycloclasticus sp.]|nr:NAD(P)H-hydrate dehydratase [Cycloclasticus sp.]MBQ0789545.1 NAD(P)H-hydrate dehydratase [Cycloclasticus sp.]